jgi:hypothetical protein
MLDAVNSHMEGDARVTGEAEHARQSRESKITVDRREVLDRIGDATVAEVDDELELRYLIDRLRDELSRRATKPAPSQN